MTLHPKQQAVVRSPARFKVVRAGRKGGKTALELETICYKATAGIKRLSLSKKVFPTGRKVLYLAPTQLQARNIIWQALKNRLHGIGVPNEQMLQMKVPNEDGEYTTIFVGGWENRENYRGLTDVIHITFDETDTLRDFFMAWLEIFRPMFLDTAGSADFVGTPKKESGNLRRLEKMAREPENVADWDIFHFTSRDNPHLSTTEIDALEAEYKNDMATYQQEVMAEYLDNAGSLFKHDALIDVFTNTVSKDGSKYLVVDVADDGSDKTIFSFWDSKEEYRREEFQGLNTEAIINQIRDYAAEDKVPYSRIMVDAIGVGAAVASSSLLNGIVGFKSSFAPMKTDKNISVLNERRVVPLVSDFKNLRSQCIFYLAEEVNHHRIASRVTSVFRERIIEELALYQDASVGDGKRFATPKEVLKEALGHSPDHCFVAGTKVLTIKGERNIEDVSIGDCVITPFGIRRVLRSGKTHENVLVDKVVFSNGKHLIATSGHKIYVNGSIRTIDTLSIGDKIETSKLSSLILWRFRNIFNLTTKNIGFRQMVDTITRPSTTAQERVVELVDRCIEIFGSFTTVKRFLRASSFTILMEIPTIIVLKIYSHFLRVCTVATIGRKNGKVMCLDSGRQRTSTEHGLRRQSGIEARMDASGTLQTVGSRGKNDSRLKRVVTSVEFCIKRIGRLVRGHAVVDVIKDYTRADVYNLTVDHDNIYYANSILVSNSDTWIMRMYFEIKGTLSPNQSPEYRAKMAEQAQRFVATQFNTTRNDNR